MKRTISVLLILCIAAGLLASCGKAESAATKVQTTVTELSTVEETTSEETTAKPSYPPLVMTPAKPFDPADRLEPTQADYDRLTGLLYWSDFDSEDYDSDHDRILDYIANAGTVSAGMEVYDLLREGDNYGYIDGMDGDRMHIGRDPRHYASEYGGYKKIRADVMEYYLENVFHNFTYPQAREGNGSYTDNEGNEFTYWMYYYEDGWYYFDFDARDDDTVLLVRESETKQDGHYLLTVDRVSAFDHDFIEATFQVDATLIQKDGRRLWTIYGTTVQYNRYADLNNSAG